MVSRDDWIEEYEKQREAFNLSIPLANMWLIALPVLDADRVEFEGWQLRPTPYTFSRKVGNHWFFLQNRA